MGSQNTIDARIKLVEEHIRAENSHEVDAIMATFGKEPRFVLNGTSIEGSDGIRAFYQGFGFEDAGSFSNVKVEVEKRHISDDSIILEVKLSGTHTAEWQGIAATNKSFEIPLCAVITFDDEGKMAGERVYLDTSLLLRQLGVLS
jgi:steroid delta-isomerase-like uncharacterized protein